MCLCIPVQWEGIVGVVVAHGRGCRTSACPVLQLNAEGPPCSILRSSQRGVYLDMRHPFLATGNGYFNQVVVRRWVFVCSVRHTECSCCSPNLDAYMQQKNLEVVCYVQFI